MSAALNEKSVRVAERLGPRMSQITQQAAREALRLHASEVSIEHVLCAAMSDEDCAAHEIVCHAFADPDTLFEESLALAPGLLVVASASTLPFSEGTVNAFRSAVAATAAGSPIVTAELAAAACRALSDSQRALLGAIGFDVEQVYPRFASEELAALPEALFSEFDEDAKKALSRSNRAAASLHAKAIGPAHLLLGCLQTDEALVARLGYNFSRMRLTLSQDHLDSTPTPERELALDEGLLRFLSALPEKADSLAFLAALHATETADLSALLHRHKVTPELLSRARDAFTDSDL